MQKRIALCLLLSALLLASCTPAANVRLHNRCGSEISVEWYDSYVTVVAAGDDEIVGSGYLVSSNGVVTIKRGETTLRYRIPEVSSFPEKAIRLKGFPAAAGSREYCLEIAEDYAIYAVDAKTHVRLEVQTWGFPIVPIAE